MSVESIDVVKMESEVSGRRGCDVVQEEAGPLG